jgi:DNA-binding MurR/RpiR family transcriptional regulator
MDFAALSKRIADDFSHLSPQLQRAARHVLDRPDDVALMSMRGLAANASVHPSTMVRLARAFDYSSYNDFREPFQQRLRVRPAGYLERARDLQARGAGEAPRLLQEVLSTDVANLRETFDTNGAENLIACAEALAKARRVYVLGLRSCFPVAFFFHYAHRMFCSNGILLDGRGGTFADDLRAFGKDDLIFAVSVDPYTYETVRAVDYAKDQGGTAVVLTDSRVSPLAKRADHVVTIRTDTPSFFHSITAAIATAEALIALMVSRGGKPALYAIEESERQLGGFDAYWHKETNTRGKKRATQ